MRRNLFNREKDPTKRALASIGGDIGHLTMRTTLSQHVDEYSAAIALQAAHNQGVADGTVIPVDFRNRTRIVPGEREEISTSAHIRILTDVEVLQALQPVHVYDQDQAN